LKYFIVSSYMPKDKYMSRYQRIGIAVGIGIGIGIEPVHAVIDEGFSVCRSQ
jgi:hypothetical protein